MPVISEMFITQSMNKRLGTRSLKMRELAIEAAKRNISGPQLMAIPEMDGWLYEGIEPRDGEAYVCSSYLVAVFKAAGLFGDLQVEATEFTPRDLYELDFFDNKYTECHDEYPFCQIMGKYQMAFPGYGSIAPYSHMNERCEMIAPLYERTPNC